MSESYFRPVCRDFHRSVANGRCPGCFNEIVDGRLCAPHPDVDSLNRMREVFFDQEALIVARVDMSSLLSEYLELTWREHNEKAFVPCPWHTGFPDMFVYPRRGRFSCVICNLSGNIIDFVMLLERKTCAVVINELAAFALERDID